MSQFTAEEIRRAQGGKSPAEMEETIAALTAERDKLLEDIKERDLLLTMSRAEHASCHDEAAHGKRERLEGERDALRTALEGTPPLSVWVGCQYGLQPDVDAITDWMQLKIEALGGKS